ncbi:Hypothetical predicted protein [Pelobates cultripes]|uniref:Uncharacterized protein n=1 Tax=Pelobates cultripes TaxID=61616 RepID=A0AAD1WLG1_PELCU|nr:Hypothetical predicted protein [Pelobates cultripes]
MKGGAPPDFRREWRHLARAPLLAGLTEAHTCCNSHPNTAQTPSTEPPTISAPEDMGGGRKSSKGSAVAPIFRSRAPEEGRRAEEQRESDSDSTASDMSHRNTTPITREDLRGLLQDIKENMAAEFAKHLAPLRAGLTDLVQRTSSLEDKMAATSSRANTHEQALQNLTEQGDLLQPTPRSTPS